MVVGLEMEDFTMLRRVVRALPLVFLSTSILATVASRTIVLAPEGGLEPRGFHLALHGPNTVRVLWQTSAGISVAYEATCLYGTSNSTLTRTASGRSYTYNASGFAGALHEVALSDLSQGEAVFYRCGSGTDMSSIFHFTVQPQHVRDDDDRPWIGSVADMGVQESAETMASLLEAFTAGNIQLLVHAGDISYADDYEPVGNTSYIWDRYMDLMQPIAANVPYMTAPGNHERPVDFASYINRFQMPYTLSKSSSPLYYSFDYLGVHFTMYSTEEDFSNGSAQQKWIEEDLARASLNRDKVPWLIVVGHRPLYCSDLIQYIPRCLAEAVFFRRDLEWILHKYKVDVYLCGHNHQYERSYPVYELEAATKSYRSPNATVYIVNGAAGSREKIDPTFVLQEMVPWRAAHGHWEETSWLRMRPGPTTLEFEAVRSSDNSVFDEFVIEK